MAQTARARNVMQDEEARVAHDLKTKKYVEEPEVLPWYQKDPPAIDPDARDLLENYAKIAPTDVEAHIKKVRDEAFKVFPYPCLGNWHFLDTGVTHNPAYTEVLERVKGGAQLLDLGCCMGQDMRKLVHDGAPSENLTGSDLTGGFWDVSYDLFRDGATLKSKFIEADIFDAESKLKDVDGQIDIVQVSSLFHLFDWEKQVKAGKRIVQLLKPEPGVIITGRQLGFSQAGSYSIFKMANTYLHNPASWAKLWKQVGDETGTKWNVTVSLGEEDLSKKTTAFIPTGTSYMVFAMRRQ